MLLLNRIFQAICSIYASEPGLHPDTLFLKRSIDIYSANSRHERLLNLIRQAQENPGTDFVITDRHGDIGVAPKPERACKPTTKPMSLAELFHLK